MVNWARPLGIYGNLDIDDIYGYGPEHYFTVCGKMTTGVFSFRAYGYYVSKDTPVLVSFRAGPYYQVRNVTVSQRKFTMLVTSL